MEAKGPDSIDDCIEDIEDIVSKDHDCGTSTCRSKELSKHRPRLLILLAGQVPLKATTSTLGSKPTRPPGEADGKLDMLPKLPTEASADGAVFPLIMEVNDSAVAKPPKTLSNPSERIDAKLFIGCGGFDIVGPCSPTDDMEPKMPKLPLLPFAVLPQTAPPGEEAKLSSDGARLAGAAVGVRDGC